MLSTMKANYLHHTVTGLSATILQHRSERARPHCFKALPMARRAAMASLQLAV